MLPALGAAASGPYAGRVRATFLLFLVPVLLFALMVVALIVLAIRRALASNRPDARATYRAQAAAELEADRASLAPTPPPEALRALGRSQYRSFGFINVSGEVRLPDGRDVARWRLRWGAGAQDAVIVTRAHTWTLASGAGGVTVTRDGQPFGTLVGGALLDATGATVGELGRALGGWQPVLLFGRAAGELNVGALVNHWTPIVIGTRVVGGDPLVRDVPRDASDAARAWLTLLALRTEVERGRSLSNQT